MKIRLILILVVTLLGISTSALALFKAGDKAPDFNGRTLDEQSIKLSDLKGKMLLVEMGATWCPSCNELAHQIDGLRDYLKKKEISFVSVYLADSAEDIRARTKDESLKPADIVMIDSGEARRSYNVFSIPRLLLIDENFEIVFDEMPLNSKRIRQRIEKHRSAE